MWKYALGLLAILGGAAFADGDALPGGETRTPTQAVLDKEPKLLEFVEAPRPAGFDARGRVEVVLLLDVDADGHLTNATVQTPAGDGFDEAALEAARKFNFTPGEAGGKRVPVRITYRYVFNAPVEAKPQAEKKSDTVPLKGRVLRKGDRVPLVGVVVLFDDGADYKTTTDANGRFEFDAVPVGDHKVKLRGPDVRPADQKLKLTAGKALEVTYYIEFRDRYSSTVRGERVVQETSEITLSADELKRIPGTQGDTLKAVQNLPGVARAPFGGGLLVVWGSAPGDTRTYVDGVFIPTLYHFGGLRSTVNSEFVSSLTFLPGGYGVEHGRGLGGAIEVQSRKPRSDGYHGYAQFDLIDASLSVEGPITKNVSFALGVRRSLIEVFLPLITTNDFQLSPAYYDYQARLSVRATPRDDVDVFVFGSDDQIKLLLKNADPALSAAFDSHTYYHRALVRWTHRFRKATLTVTPSIGYDVPLQFKGALGATPFSIDAGTFEYNLRAVAHVPVAPWLRIDGGLDLEGNHYSLGLQIPMLGGGANDGGTGGGNGGAASLTGALTNDSLALEQAQIAPFLALNFTFWQKLTVTPQLRLDTYVFAGTQGSGEHFSHAYFAPEPRLALRYEIKKWVALKAAVGVYHQAPAPTSFLKLFGNPEVAPEFGLHYVLGVEFRPTGSLHIEAQGFYKDLRSLVVAGEHVGDPAQVNDGIGRVYGGEILIRQELWKGFFGWVAYTVSRSERRDHPDQPWRLFQFDQTHILTLIASYKFGRGFQIGARFRYVTGNPYTPVDSAYYDINTAAYRPVNGAPFSARLDGFHQLDVRFDKTWTFRLWRLSIYLDLQNLYRHDNPEGITYNYNYTKTASISGLPFLPVIGFRGDF